MLCLYKNDATFLENAKKYVVIRKPSLTSQMKPKLVRVRPACRVVLSMSLLTVPVRLKCLQVTFDYNRSIMTLKPKVCSLSIGYITQ